MKSLLVGNGVNIQFGGKAYSNYFIMQRIKFRAKLDSYLGLFGNALTISEIISIFDGFVNIANDIRDGKYDELTKDKDDTEALIDFKNRYTKKITKSYEIMLEDWFCLFICFS